MHPFRSATQATSVAAAPAAVFALVSDPRRLPEWAPGFLALGVPFTVRDSAGAGTIDIVVSEHPPAGVFARVLPNGEGSELVFTLILPFEVDDARLASQTATLETELATLRLLCEAA
jgi:hypothetical protein